MCTLKDLLPSRRRCRYAFVSGVGTVVTRAVSSAFHRALSGVAEVYGAARMSQTHVMTGLVGQRDGPLVPTCLVAASVIDPIVDVRVTAREPLLWPARRLAVDARRSTRQRPGGGTALGIQLPISEVPDEVWRSQPAAIAADRVCREHYCPQHAVTADGALQNRPGPARPSTLHGPRTTAIGIG